jgi:hypothetical protein
LASREPDSDLSSLPTDPPVLPDCPQAIEPIMQIKAAIIEVVWKRRIGSISEWVKLTSPESHTKISERAGSNILEGKDNFIWRGSQIRRYELTAQTIE